MFRALPDLLDAASILGGHGCGQHANPLVCDAPAE